MLNDVKDNIYSFFKAEMAVAFPALFPLDEDGFSEKIYWKKIRDIEPIKPYIILDDVIKGKLNKACETYRREGDRKLVKRENWMMMVTFGVYSQGTQDDLATPERQATDIIERIEDLFNSPETFDFLSNNGIIVDEKQVSNIRDLSSFEETNYNYRYEIDITFKFDIIKEPKDYGIGEKVGYDINVKDTELYITNEIGD
jgi:hypothetical protein